MRNMKQIILRILLLTTLFIILMQVISPFGARSREKAFTLPGLPQPIAKAPIVITSAGQSTDSYIIRDISNQLMLRSYFMPQAKENDIKDIQTIVFVVGYSSLGVKLQNITYEEEKRRIEKLLQKAEEDNLTVIAVVLGGERFHVQKTEELIRLICIDSDYIIGLKDSCHEGILHELAKSKDIPLTLVNEVKAFSEPFASAFR